MTTLRWWTCCWWSFAELVQGRGYRIAKILVRTRAGRSSDVSERRSRPRMAPVHMGRAFMSADLWPCPRCATRIPSDSLFCPRCGLQLMPLGSAPIASPARAPANAPPPILIRPNLGEDLAALPQVAKSRPVFVPLILFLIGLILFVFIANSSLGPDFANIAGTTSSSSLRRRLSSPS